MSENQESDDELKLWMKNLPTHDLVIWLEDMRSRLNRMLDPENPMEPERRFEELSNMSQGFLFLSKQLLELAKIANKATGSMVKPSMGENALGPKAIPSTIVEQTKDAKPDARKATDDFV